MRAASARVNRLIRRLGEWWFKVRYGPETMGFWYHADSGSATSNNVWYDPTEWLALRKALRRLRMGPIDVIADLGSGKGRAVLTIATLPVGRVIGVELSPELTAIARVAVERNRDRLACRQIELVTADVRSYEFPDDLTAVYLFSPFVGPTFATFIARLLEFTDGVKRPVLVLYNYPFEHNQLVATGRAQVIDVCSATWPAGELTVPEVIVTYRIVPSTVPSDSPGGLTLPPGAECWSGPYDPGFVLELPQGKVWRSSPNWRRDPPLPGSGGR